jgi:hypothetical protein
MKEVAMSRCSRITAFAALSILWCGVSSAGETMRCQSVNGNLNCAGSGGVSCQTVDGKKVCVSGHGDVMQSFGGGSSAGNGASHDDSTDDDEGLDSGHVDSGRSDNRPSVPAMKQRLERRDGHGGNLLLQRDGTRLHIHNDWLSVDRE